MCAYVINITVVLIIFPVILQTVINVIMLSIGGQGAGEVENECTSHNSIVLAICMPKISKFSGDMTKF